MKIFEEELKDVLVLVNSTVMRRLPDDEDALQEVTKITGAFVKEACASTRFYRKNGTGLWRRGEDGNFFDMVSSDVINADAIDMAYAPPTYWSEYPTADELLSRIKGERRQGIAREIMKKQGFVGLTEFIGKEVLDYDEIMSWTGVHPSHLGGEFLPDLFKREIEIARVSLESVTCDPISVRATCNDGNIEYRVVDEHGTNYELSLNQSQNPLTLAELVELVDRASWWDTNNLVIGPLENLYGDAELDTLKGFVSIQSPFYPDLATYYTGILQEWFEVKRVEICEDYEDEEFEDINK